MTEDLIKEFIQKVILKKKEDLLSIKMDLMFHFNQKKSMEDEKKLRADLKKQKESKKPDVEVMETLESKINQSTAISKKINELNSIEPQIVEYINFLNKNKNKFIKIGLDL